MVTPTWVCALILFYSLLYDTRDVALVAKEFPAAPPFLSTSLSWVWWEVVPVALVYSVFCVRAAQVQRA